MFKSKLVFIDILIVFKLNVDIWGYSNYTKYLLMIIHWNENIKWKQILKSVRCNYQTILASNDDVYFFKDDWEVVCPEFKKICKGLFNQSDSLPCLYILKIEESQLMLWLWRVQVWCLEPNDSIRTSAFTLTPIEPNILCMAWYFYTTHGYSLPHHRHRFSNPHQTWLFPPPEAWH